jgi:hypothetical protein
MAPKNQVKKDCFLRTSSGLPSTSYCSAPNGSSADLTPPVPMEVRYSAAKKTENCFPVAAGHEIPSHGDGRSGEIPADKVSSTRPCIHSINSKLSAPVA